VHHYEPHWQSSTDQAVGDVLARKARFLQQILSPNTPDTGGPEAGAVSADELNALWEEPGLRLRVQEQAERIQADVRARTEQAAAAELRRPADRPWTAAEGHAPTLAADTARRRDAHGQEQAAAREQHRPQGPGRS
jgi:hypothetical protein